MWYSLLLLIRHNVYGTGWIVWTLFKDKKVFFLLIHEKSLNDLYTPIDVDSKLDWIGPFFTEKNVKA